MVIIVYVFLWVVEMAEWGMAERQNGGMAEWRTGYIPNLPDIFTVHTDACTYFLLLHVLILLFCTWYKSYWGGDVHIPPFNKESK